MLSFLPFLVIIVVFWFFMIRPQAKRQREAQQMQAELTAGAKVMLTSGIFGTVREVTDDYVLVEVSETSSIKVIRNAIGRILPEDFGQPQVADTDAAPIDGDHPVTGYDDADRSAAQTDVTRVEPIEPEENR